MKKRHCVIFKFFLIIFISSAFVGKVIIDSAGIDTEIKIVHGPVFLNSRGVHIGSVAVLGKTGFGVTV